MAAGPRLQQHRNRNQACPRAQALFLSTLGMSLGFRATCDTHAGQRARRRLWAATPPLTAAPGYCGRPAGPAAAAAGSWWRRRASPSTPARCCRSRGAARRRSRDAARCRSHGAGPPPGCRSHLQGDAQYLVTKMMSERKVRLTWVSEGEASTTDVSIKGSAIARAGLQVQDNGQNAPTTLQQPALTWPEALGPRQALLRDKVQGVAAVSERDSAPAPRPLPGVPPPSPPPLSARARRAYRAPPGAHSGRSVSSPSLFL